MVAFYGNTSTSALSTPYNISCVIKSFSIVNKTGGAVTVNAGILYGSTYLFIPLNKSLASGEAYVHTGKEIVVPAGCMISVSASGSIDYYFSIE